LPAGGAAAAERDRGQLILAEDFARLPAEPWRTGKGRWEIVDGTLRATELPEEKHAASARHPLSVRDVVVECSVKLDGARHAIIKLNGTLAHCCQLLLAPDGVTLEKYVDDAGTHGWSVVERRPATIRSGEWHTLTLETRGPEVIGTLDGATVVRGRHESIAADKTTLILNVAGESASFKGLKVWNVAAAAKATDVGNKRESRPNVVVILADDLGYGDAACYNPAAKVAMPNIDRLAGEGMRFTDAHSGSSVCTPTRYGLLTGRYAWRTRLQKGVFYGYEPPLIAEGRLTVPALLKQHGYHTACIGKWHLGWDWPMAEGATTPDFTKPIGGGPTTRGFDEYFGTHVPNQPPYVFIERDRTVGLPTAEKKVDRVAISGRAGPMLPGWKFEEILPTLTSRAVEYIDRRAKTGGPFFLYVPLTTPHEPVSPSARFQGRSGINPLADLMMETDWAVGEIKAALDRNGLNNDTLFIFTADNGHATYTGLQPLLDAGHQPSGPLRGYKTDVYEGGHRVMFIVRQPGVIRPGSTCDATICHTTLLATCADLLGAKLPAEASEDGASILPLLRGETPERPVFEAVVHHAASGQFAIRQGRWKLNFPGPPKKDGGEPAPLELFDLTADLGETTNVAKQHADVVSELTKLMRRYVAEGRSTPGPAQLNDVAVVI
jgi:arylsulfatase A-like enzyme